jgi:hypothetical protein
VTILNFDTEKSSEIAGKSCAFLSGFVQVTGAGDGNSRLPKPSHWIVNNMTGAALFDRLRLH